MGDELVEIASYPSQIAADVAVQLLEEAGIRAMRSSDGAGGTLPPLAAATGGHRVSVNAADAAEAREVLAAADTGE